MQGWWAGEATARRKFSGWIGEYGNLHGVRITLVDEDTEATLLREARRATVVVTGCRGRGPITGTLLGSVSRSSATRAPCTVVVVRCPRKNRQPANGPIVVGVDDPASGAAAIRFASTRPRRDTPSWKPYTPGVAPATGPRRIPYSSGTPRTNTRIRQRPCSTVLCAMQNVIIPTCRCAVSSRRAPPATCCSPTRPRPTSSPLALHDGAAPSGCPREHGTCSAPSRRLPGRSGTSALRCVPAAGGLACPPGPGRPGVGAPPGPPCCPEAGGGCRPQRAQGRPGVTGRADALKVLADRLIVNRSGLPRKRHVP